MHAARDAVDQAASERSARLKGIALISGAFFLFSCLDATAKYLVQFMDPLQIAWARYAFHLVFALILLNPLTVPGVLASRHLPLEISRAVLLIGTTIANFFAVRYLQLAETVSIMFAGPFLVALLAGPLLGEWAGPRRWAAIIVGFLGVLVVTRPGTDAFHPAMIVSFLGVVCYAVYAIQTRMLAAYDSAETMIVYSAVFAVLALTPVVPFVWTSPDSALLWLLLVATGIFGGLGHYLLILAHRLAPAPVLAPFNYIQIVWMVALGFLVFGDVPGAWTIAGAGIVISSGLYLLYRERRTRPRQLRHTPRSGGT